MLCECLVRISLSSTRTKGRTWMRPVLSGTVFVGSWVQLLGVVTALVSGVLATVANYR